MLIHRHQPKRQKKKPVACSGEQPCARCRQAGCGALCEYQQRDRKLKVNESYVDQILLENAHLKDRLENLTSSRSSPATSDQISSYAQGPYRAVQNLLLGERAWFYPYDPSAPPIYMGAAACTAFATRLRQFLTRNPNAAHIARTQYTPEALLLEGETQWPGLPQARLLVRIAFNQLSRVYHLFLRKSTMEQLESIYRDPSKRDDPSLTCKFFALFALGEIRDDDIHVDMPSQVSCPAYEEQFSDTSYLVASIQLARIIGQVLDKIYSHKQHPESFLQREQQLLLAQQEWLQSLPAHIKLHTDGGSPPKHIVSLHLQFNQCVILATRPIILHALLHQRGHQENSEDPLPQPVITLSEACIHAARHSHALIIEEWVNGSLPIYGYFYAQYLFSSATVLVISGLLPAFGNPADLDSLEVAIEILSRMSDHGNLAAAEFHENLKQVKQSLSGDVGKSFEKDGQLPRQSLQRSFSLPPTRDRAIENGGVSPLPAAGFTTEMAFLEPMMQDFLGIPDNGIEAIHPDLLSIGESTGEEFWSTTFWTS
ncbi:hypothetical protein ETB97_007693 [Aspergillus alliaceus]|uniref:Transcription factor domain-containing protein n=1 Tax=Petromyces alliaceus TaxID=209559 RepID=A0A8H6E1U0_PETAA|nr:hypothetical protein ETB97_007693 [Aspergillus burnettii]